MMAAAVDLVGRKANWSSKDRVLEMSAEVPDKCVFALRTFQRYEIEPV